MKTQISTSKVVMAATMVVAIVLASIFYTGKEKANKNLDQEKLKSEKILSEKIQLDEKIANMKTQLNSLTGKNAQLDKMVSERNKQLQKKEAEIIRLLAENASVSTLKKKIAELEALQDKLNSDLKQMNLSYNTLKDENAKLNGLLSTSQNENDILGVNNAILKAMVADNYRVEALKGKNNKLTINAKRTDKLMVSFDMPANVTNGLNFKVIDPKGNEFSSITNKAVSVSTVSNNDYLLASKDNYTGQVGTSRSELIYKPEHKLEKGVYIIKIFNGKDYIGSTQLRLR